MHLSVTTTHRSTDIMDYITYGSYTIFLDTGGSRTEEQTDVGDKGWLDTSAHSSFLWQHLTSLMS